MLRRGRKKLLLAKVKNAFGRIGIFYLTVQPEKSNIPRYYVYSFHGESTKPACLVQQDPKQSKGHINSAVQIRPLPGGGGAFLVLYRFSILFFRTFCGNLSNHISDFWYY